MVQALGAAADRSRPGGRRRVRLRHGDPGPARTRRSAPSSGTPSSRRRRSAAPGPPGDPPTSRSGSVTARCGLAGCGTVRCHPGVGRRRRDARAAPRPAGAGRPVGHPGRQPPIPRSCCCGRARWTATRCVRTASARWCSCRCCPQRRLDRVGQHPHLYIAGTLCIVHDMVCFSWTWAVLHVISSGP